MTVLLKGKRLIADIAVISDEAGVIDADAIMARDNRRFAAFDKITLDRRGQPDRHDLQLAGAAGARAFRLTAAAARPGSPDGAPK